jgi:hypothetical protein
MFFAPPFTFFRVFALPFMFLCVSALPFTHFLGFALSLTPPLYRSRAHSIYVPLHLRLPSCIDAGRGVGRGAATLPTKHLPRWKDAATVFVFDLSYTFYCVLPYCPCLRFIFYVFAQPFTSLLYRLCSFAYYLLPVTFVPMPPKLANGTHNLHPSLASTPHRSGPKNQKLANKTYLISTRLLGQCYLRSTPRHASASIARVRVLFACSTTQ